MVEYAPPPKDRDGGSGIHIALNKFFQSLEDGGKTYLGDMAQVQQLLRSFLADAMDRRSGPMSPERWEQVKKEELEAFAQMARIFLGQDDRFETLGAWNTDSSIAIWCARSLGIEWDGHGDDTAVMQDVFAQLLMEVLEIPADDPGTPEDEWQMAVDDTINRWVRMLVGIPDNFDDPPTLGEMAADLIEDEKSATP